MMREPRARCPAIHAIYSVAQEGAPWGALVVGLAPFTMDAINIVGKPVLTVLLVAFHLRPVLGGEHFFQEDSPAISYALILTSL
jgi:hypothetical protein